jgi:thiamine-monophosphate kinase
VAPRAVPVPSAEPWPRAVAVSPEEDEEPMTSPRSTPASPAPDGATVGDVGEFGLIAQVTARLTQGAPVEVGPGDDAAVLAAPDGRVVATTDLLVEGRHFRRAWSSAYDVGRKAAAQNLADVVAMGAVPTALLVGLGSPPDLPAAWALEMADGLRDEAAQTGASVVGGDVVRASVLTVAVTALGDLQGREPVLRSGARPGDLVVLAGRTGWAAAGLAVLGRGFRSPKVLVEAHRRPEPPYALGPELARRGATAMVDVSDGLLADLGHVADASGVRVALDRAAFPVPEAMTDVARALNADPYDWLLAGGDDHALAATVPDGTPVPEGVRVVGRVEEGEGVVVDGEAPAAARGHAHFS